jgi:hypothetical protein
MARPSRPPGFDMTYRPAGSISFGPPLREMLPALAYLTFAAAVGAFIVYGQNAPSSSRAFYYVVEADRHRLLPASVCGIVLLGSALAAVVRSWMRGVVVHPEGIEMRELLTLGWPRVRRLRWSQIDRVVMPRGAGQGATRGAIGLDLWDGTRTWLPAVGDLMGLAHALGRVALARAIPVDGDTTLLDEISASFLDDADG